MNDVFTVKELEGLKNLIKSRSDDLIDQVSEWSAKSLDIHLLLYKLLLCWLRS